MKDFVNTLSTIRYPKSIPPPKVKRRIGKTKSWQRNNFILVVSLSVPTSKTLVVFDCSLIEIKLLNMLLCIKLLYSEHACDNLKRL